MKKLSIKQILMSSFNFTYAGQVFVTIVPQRNKFTVCSNGVHILQDIVSFLPDYKVRYTYDDLYTAICQFDYIIKRIIESKDWFNKNHFLEDFDKIRLKDLA